MQVEVQPVNGRADVSVAERAFRPVPEGQHHQAVRPDGRLRGPLVDPVVADLPVRAVHGVLLHPAVADTGAVEAQQHTVAPGLGAVVDVDEGVHSRGVVMDGTVHHAVHHAARARRRRQFPRLQDIQAEGIIGLVAATVGDRRPLRDPEFGSRSPAHSAMDGKARRDGRKDVGVNPVVGKQERCRRLGPGIPEDALGEPRRGGHQIAGHAVREVVAGQHHLPDPREDVRLVGLHPRELRGGEVAGGVEQPTEAALPAQRFKRLLAVRHGATVTPDDGGPEHGARGINDHQAVHLVGDTNPAHIIHGGRMILPEHGDGARHVLPPEVRVLLRPPRLRGVYDQLGIRGGSRRNDLSALHRDQAGLDRAAADVKPQQVAGHGYPSMSFTRASTV